MLDRIVFGGIGGIMGHANLQAHAVAEALEVLLEQVLGSAVAAAAIAKQQQGFGLGPGGVSLGGPPLENAVTGKFAGVIADAEVDVAPIAFEIVQSVRDDMAL